MEFLSFVAGIVRDPQSKDLSSTRSSALALVTCACILALRHPTDGVAMVGTLLGGGAASFFLREVPRAGP